MELLKSNTESLMLLKRIMQKENCTFEQAIKIVDRLSELDLLNTYLEMMDIK